MFTLGLFLWSRGRIPGYVLVIPILYAFSGVIPMRLGVVEDAGLIASGVIVLVLVVYRDWIKKKVAEPRLQTN